MFTIIRGCGNKKGRTYKFEKASVGEVKKTILVTGVLEVMDLYTILSKTNGMVLKVYADFNQKVGKGELLAKIDSTSVEQDLLKLQAQLQGVRIELVAAQQELDAKKNMYKDNLISKSGMEQAEIKYETTNAKFKQVKLDYDLALTQKKNMNIFSPISGIIINREISDNVPIAVNARLFEIAPNLEKMRLIINVDESDIGYMKADQKVTFTVSAHPEKIFEGKVAQVRMKPVDRGGVVNYQAVVTCNNPQHFLKPGMTATALVVVGDKQNVLRVVNQAFTITPDDSKINPFKKIVWKKNNTIGGDEFTPVEVKIGLVGDMYTEILGNIKKGEKVLVKVIDKGTSE